jgi:hypothetical protein
VRLVQAPFAELGADLVEGLGGATADHGDHDDRLGVRIRAEVVLPGALDAWTEVHTSPKPKRFRDER